MSLAPSSRLGRAAEKMLDFLLPPQCLACDAPVGANKSLCAACWGQIHFLAPPVCESCGLPFDAPVGDGLLCAACVAYPPTFAKARAAMLYDDASKRLVLSFKHGDRTHTAEALAIWMERAGRDFWPTSDVLVPVPLHRWRLFARRYNQAALLAQRIGVLAQKPVLVDALVRLRATPHQGHRNRKERHDNVKNAFAVAPGFDARLQGKTVTLIDDVLTTGATVNTCAKTLLNAGAAAVNVLTLARVRSYT